MLECEATGKNIEQAITNALFELKATREDVDIKILEQGGLFKKAKVYVKISDDVVEKYQQKQSRRQAEKQVLKEEVKEEKKETKEETKAEKESVQTFKETEKENKKEKAEEKQTIKNETKQEKPKAKTTEKVLSGETEVENGKTFLKGILEVLNISSEILVEENEEEIYYVINGENASQLIGYRGDGLNAIQYLVSIVNSKNNRHSKKVRLDIDGFKEKRKNTLQALAHRVAKKVEKTKHQIKLEPMTAYERRIIHTVIQEYQNLSSFSQGEEPNRYLVIKYVEE